ncbi:MAG: hypothetical protein AAFP86_17315, partial [Planctomycetota bacterium]
ALLAVAPVQNGAVPMPGPLKHAGTYDAVTGTLVPGGSPGSDPFVVRYSNTASPVMFVPTIGPTGTVPGGTVSDTGFIPGDFGPPIDTQPGYDEILVDAFRFAYCDLDPAAGTTSWELEFRTRLGPCEAPTGAPTYTIQLTGLPANGCWTVEVDLSGGAEFCLESEGGDRTFDGDPSLDNFGWSVRYTGSGTAPAGVVLAGDPSTTDGTSYSNPNTTGAANPPAPPSVLGAATFFNPFTSGCTEGTRLLGRGSWTPDGFRIDPPVLVGPGTCVDGAYVNAVGLCGTATFPFSGLYLELDGPTSCDPTVAGDLCNSSMCPTSPNSTGRSGVVRLTGSRNPADDDVTLHGRDLPPGQFGIFLHGVGLTATPIVVGTGFLCIDGPGRIDEPAQILQISATGEVELSTASGLLDLAALPIGSAPFTYAATAGTFSYFTFWHRDLSTPAFNFATTCQLFWQ